MHKRKRVTYILGKRRYLYRLLTKVVIVKRVFLKRVICMHFAVDHENTLKVLIK